ncbi:uncharacterized protein TrAFT101_009946 [Trichoderma asperellum]|uniref:Uncharacterized protein n=1 Tax=Trichoderma asperellum (strain ATCC 204424 / CBS 433.97 / NBRC 101777) TaxID=1042311 RepID=A0A2T3Z9I2_TRIA4|nr:hypothetical protein M441DRAFT_398512 [Trichoderma asperellum CBS 433.97]PTB41446.1 hypothetical protein M441DRAFT_398512 [Trichoderma asperellum CBS 433.97]UKZ95096.1 hypothetical protein TrAFT101_009946 [Trichoderma asperellum]
MCITVYSLFTVCGHYPPSDEQRCATYSSYSTPRKKFVDCCDNEAKIVKFVFGWCPDCEIVLFEGVTTGKGKEKAHDGESRNIHAVRRYWEYKFIIGCATAINATTRLRFIVSLDRDMAMDSPTRTSISMFNRLLEMLELGREMSLSQRAMDFRTLTVDEATLQRALLRLKPSEIWLGPGKHSYAIAGRDGFATMLHMVRIGTIMWANGDDEVYEKEPSVSSHWESPYAPGIWNVTRYGEAVAGAAEAPYITGLTWREGIKLRLESILEAWSYIV